MQLISMPAVNRGRMEMGCYGIGITRVVAAAIEQNHDNRGIIWPLPLAPFAVAIAPVGYDRNEGVKALADSLHDTLEAAGIEVLLDDRGERPGVMFADLELIGLPHRVTIGERGLKEGKVEYQARRDAAGNTGRHGRNRRLYRKEAWAGMRVRATIRYGFRVVTAIAAAAVLWPRLVGCHSPARRSRRSSQPLSSRACSARSPTTPSRSTTPNSSGLRSWLVDMSRRLAPKVSDARSRDEFMTTVHYEAARAGLDPQLVLGVIQHESNFRKYAVSSADARGYMQVMPFWTKLIGASEHNLFHLRTNLRYGCVILRHYLDTENGDLYRALGRYNGSLGRPEYPNAVLATMNRNWLYEPTPTPKIGIVPASYTAR